jgi:hypothetical protein
MLIKPPYIIVACLGALLGTAAIAEETPAQGPVAKTQPGAAVQQTPQTDAKQEQLQKMHELSKKMATAKDDAERQKLREERLKLMADFRKARPAPASPRTPAAATTTAPAASTTTPVAAPEPAPVAPK